MIMIQHAHEKFVCKMTTGSFKPWCDNIKHVQNRMMTNIVYMSVDDMAFIGTLTE